LVRESEGFRTLGV